MLIGLFVFGRFYHDSLAKIVEGFHGSIKTICRASSWSKNW
jgi:hypothetical protein